MNIIESILQKKIKKEVYESLKEKGLRYEIESAAVYYLAQYALNKEKNKVKPKFEEMKLTDIYNHLVSEVSEVKHEIDQKKIDFERLLSEIADCAALLSGLVAYVLENKDKVDNYEPK